MKLRWLCWAAAAALLIPIAARAQDAPPPSPTPLSSRLTFDSVPPPPVPDDPLELVTDDAQPVTDPEQRAAEIAVLDNARNLSYVRAHPYDLNTTFTSFDPASGTNSEWTEEDIWPGQDIYRWSTEGPQYSAIFLTKDSLLSSNQPTNAIPLRLAQVRDAIFFAYTWVHEHASVRTATGTLAGEELHCILIAHNVGTRILTGARNWDEYEYCIEPNTGLLMTYSPAPGIYYHYDYQGAAHFHGKIIPSEFTISEAGRIVVEARTLSVTDPVGPNSPIFSGEGLKPLGTGPATLGAAVFSVGGGFLPNLRPQTVSSPPKLQIVVVAGITASDGHLAESEILASTAEDLDQAAIDQANKFGRMQCGCGPGTAPGAVKPSREVIYVVRIFQNAT
jgi:hypothetical protein